MANALATSYKKLTLDADLDLLVDTIKVVGLSSAYTFSAAHDFLDDLTGILGTSGALTGKTTTGGVFDAADLTPAFTGISTDIARLWVFKDTGVAATSPLIYFMDTGFTHVNNGGNVNLTWNASGLFAI